MMLCASFTASWQKWTLGYGLARWTFCLPDRTRTGRRMRTDIGSECNDETIAATNLRPSLRASSEFRVAFTKVFGVDLSCVANNAISICYLRACSRRAADIDFIRHG